MQFNNIKQRLRLNPHYIVIFVSLLCIAIVIIGLLSINQQIRQVYDDSLTLNASWRTKQAIVSQLLNDLVKLKSSPNDLFATTDILRETKKYKKQQHYFDSQYALVKQTLLTAINRDDAQFIVIQLTQADQSYAQFDLLVQQVFTHYQQGQLQVATEYLLGMEQSYQKLVSNLLNIQTNLQEVQVDHLLKQSAKAFTFQQLVVWVIGGLSLLILFMVARMYAKPILILAKTLAATINQDFADPETGSINLQQKQFNLEDLMLRVCCAQQSIAKEKGVALLFDYDVQCFRYWIGDPQWLERILEKLLSNAIKYTDSGSVVLRIHQLINPAEPVSLCIEVEDTGCGLSTDQQTTLFEPASNDHDSKHLGLPMCKTLCELMNGEISVTSVTGKGALFRIFIELTITRLESTLPLKNSQLRQVKTLIIDDNVQALNILKRQLVEIGLSVVSIESAGMALEQLAVAHNDNNPYRLVIADINIPEMKTTEFAKALEKLQPLALILLTHDMSDTELNNLQPLKSVRFMEKLSLLDDKKIAIIHALI